MGRAVSATAQQSAARAHRAEDGIARMARLSTMPADQLARILGGNASEAAPWVAAAASHGVIAAQLTLGRMLLEGQGIPQNKVAALGWFRRAAQGKDAEAMNMVGRCLELGWGCAADPAAAAPWYRRSAEAGHGWGEYNYANLLFDGRGVAQDWPAAVALYRRAADGGHARAMNLLGRCHEEGWGTAIDHAAAARWYRLSAEAGYFRGQFNHAIELLRQNRVAEARVWFNRAALDADGPMLARINAVLARLEPDDGSNGT
jgi:TPR repeat protein